MNAENFNLSFLDLYDILLKNKKSEFPKPIINIISFFAIVLVILHPLQVFAVGIINVDFLEFFFVYCKIQVTYSLVKTHHHSYSKKGL